MRVGECGASVSLHWDHLLSRTKAEVHCPSKVSSARASSAHHLLSFTRITGPQGVEVGLARVRRVDLCGGVEAQAGTRLEQAGGAAVRGRWADVGTVELSPGATGSLFELTGEREQTDQFAADLACVLDVDVAGHDYVHGIRGPCDHEKLFEVVRTLPAPVTAVELVAGHGDVLCLFAEDQLEGGQGIDGQTVPV